MKILIVLTYYRPHISGLTIYVERLARTLAQRGHHVTVLTSHYEKGLPAGGRHYGVDPRKVEVVYNAIDQRFLTPPDEATTERGVNSTPPRDGFERVQVPGDPESAAEERNGRLGVELDEMTWRSLLEVARQAGVEYAGAPAA